MSSDPMAASLASLRKAGILTRFRDDDPQLARRRAESLDASEDWEGPARTLLDMAELDKERVWFSANLHAYRRSPAPPPFWKSSFYSSCLREWSSIAGGRFEPVDIREIWSGDSRTEPGSFQLPVAVEIHFRLDGRERSLRLRAAGHWWFDPGIIAELNLHLGGTGVRLRHARLARQKGDRDWRRSAASDAFCMFLTPDEQQTLETELGIAFYTDHELRLLVTDMTGETTEAELVLATRANDPDRMRALLLEGVPANALGPVPDGISPRIKYAALTVAAERKNIDAARLLLEHGASPNFPHTSQGYPEGAIGQTAMHVVASKLDHDMLRLFLANGGDPNTRTESGETPLGQALRQIHDEQIILAAVKALLEGGADPTLTDDQEAPFDIARNSPWGTVRALFERLAQRTGRAAEVESWAAATIAKLHQAHFLEDITETDPTRLVALLERRLGPLSPKSVDQFLRLLGLDERRTFDKPLHQIDDLPNLRKSAYYSECMRNWAAISMGAFSPENIVERWQGRVVEIDFDLGGVSQTLRIEPCDGFDIAILVDINRLIASSGRSFVIYCDPDNGVDTMVICVTKEERALVEEAFGFPLDDDDVMLDMRRWAREDLEDEVDE